MIYFIYGASGYGKTSALLSYIEKDVNNDKKAFILVPEQETVAVERNILSVFPAKAQLNLEVLNFSRLCNQIFRTYGGLSYDVATKGIKSLLMWNNLRELSPLLEEYKFADVTDFSLTEKMLSAVKELKAYNIPPTKIEASSEKIPKDSALYSKIRDISLIYAAYTNKLSESFSDSSDDISHAVDILKENNFFAGTNVYIDSFVGYTEQELQMISRIFDLAENVYITVGIPTPYDASIHFESLKNTVLKLKKLVDGKACEEIFLTENHRTSSEELKYLEKNLWHFEAQKFVPSENSKRSIFLYLCETPYSEAELAASEISKLIRNGTKYSEIAIIVRDTEKYRGILDTTLEKYNIPFFMSEKTDLMTKPLAKYIFSALKIKETNWRLQNVISHLKTGFSDIDPYEIDIFEDYASTWNINGNRFFDEYWTMNPDGYSEMLTERGKRILKTANSVKERFIPRLSLYFARLDAAETVSEMCRATIDFLKDSRITEKVRELYAKNIEYGNKKAAAEDLQLYQITLDILYQFSSVMGEEKLNFSEFSAALALMFSESDIGTIPTAADEVIIGSASMLRTGKIKCAIILGLNEGEFPQAVKENGIFSDADKEILSGLDINLSADSNIRAVEELYFLYRSMTSPKDTLILTCSAASSSGKSQRPSVVFERINQLFGYKSQNEKTLSPLDRIWSREVAAEYYPKIRNSETGEIVKEVLSDIPNTNFISRPDIPISQEECTVSKEIADKIFGERMLMSHSRLEKYVKCGFDYYCSYVLKLRENKKAVFQLNDMGSFVHAILERFMREITADGTLNLSLSDDEIEKVLERSITAYLTELLGESYAVSNRTKHLFLRLRKLSLFLIGNLMKEFKDSSFYPAYFELPIGFSGNCKIEALTFELNDGATVSLRGFVDRVDLYRQDGNVYVRVIDYKTGSKEFSLNDVRQGLNMQLLLYLFTICKTENQEVKKEFGCSDNGEILPAGIQYLSSNIKTVSFDEFLSDETINSKIEKNLNRTGLFLYDKDVLTAMNHDLNPDILSGVKVKNDEIMGKALASKESFDMIFDELSQTIIKIAQSMRDGVANPKPLIHSGSSPCNYCKMSALCRSAIKTRY